MTQGMQGEESDELGEENLPAGAMNEEIQGKHQILQERGKE